MESFLIMGGLTALGVIILLIRAGLRRILQFGVFTDIIVSLGLIIFFAGTFSGLMTAAIAGIAVSAFLLLAKMFVRKPKPKPKPVPRQSWLDKLIKLGKS